MCYREYGLRECACYWMNKRVLHQTSEMSRKENLIYCITTKVVFTPTVAVISHIPLYFPRPVAGKANIAQEALAGLASKENFSKVALKKADSFTATTPGASHLPYRHPMLLQVKGQYTGQSSVHGLKFSTRVKG